MNSTPPRPDATHPPIGRFLPSAPRLARRAIFAGAALVVMVVVGLALQDSQWDLPAVRALNELHVGWFGDLTTTVYFLLDPPGAIGLSALITVAVFLTTWRRTHSPIRGGTHALSYAATILITWLPITILKAVFTRARPDESLLPHPFVEYQGNTSYPSGHTSFAMISVVALFLIVATTRRTRTVVAILGTAWVAFIVLVVVSNGVHFPTDSAASILWGLCVMPFVAGLAQTGLARLDAPRPR
jgi:undecaprenyl-diphosphatase